MPSKPQSEKLSRVIREQGFSDLTELSKLSGFSIRSIQRWYPERMDRLDCIMAGASAIKRKDKAGIVIHKEPHGLGPQENCIFCYTPTRYWACDGQNPVCQSCSRLFSEKELKAKAKKADSASNKIKAVSALKRHCKGATLIDESSNSVFRVQLEAPKGHHWDGDVHCRVVGDAELGVDVGSKAEFWSAVIEDIEDLGQAVKCDGDDCEGIKEFGACQYWGAGK